MKNTHQKPTDIIADFIIKTKTSDILPDIYTHAKVAFLDWLGVTLAGKNEPLVKKLLNYSDLMGGREQATVLWHGIKKNMAHAALINGAASHALDYDDMLMAIPGHPAVMTFPALLAISEYKECSGLEFLTAFLIGFKVGAVIGGCTGIDHYLKGWHATSTIGHLTAAAVCCRILKLNKIQTLNALGIAGTQASGLKCSFGTMCKPFHAGKASEAGLASALLAADGFTGTNDVLEAPNGFFQALTGKINHEKIRTLGKTWEMEDLLQKYHASCGATHSSIEASRSILKDNSIIPTNIESIKVFSSEGGISAAGKPDPQTGLEGKFSIRYCVANALLNTDTGIQAFTDSRVNNPQVKKLMEKITVSADKDVCLLATRVELITNDGQLYTKTFDIEKDLPNLEERKNKVKLKFTDLCEPVLGNSKTNLIIEDVFALEKIQNIKDLARKF